MYQTRLALAGQISNCSKGWAVPSKFVGQISNLPKRFSRSCLRENRSLALAEKIEHGLAIGFEGRAPGRGEAA